MRNNYQENRIIVFEEKMTALIQTLFAQMNEAAELDITIRENLKLLGYE